MVYNYTKPRGPIAAMYSSPGPCYGLPGIVGQNPHDPRSQHVKGPAYSFGLRHCKYQDDCGPGPAFGPMEKLYRDGKDGAPQISMSFRPKSSPLELMPGPATYKPENSDTQMYYRAPAYTMRRRAKSRGTDSTPGPNAYTMDPMFVRTIRSGKRQSPAYTMVGKRYIGSFFEDVAQTPGPSAYKIPDLNKYKCTPPGYTITAKNYLPVKSLRGPGPADHHTESIDVVKRSAPRFTFGLRHSAFAAPMIIDTTE